MRDRLVGTALFSTLRGMAGVALVAALAGCSFTSPDAATGSQFVGIDGVSAPEARRIAKEAYVYGYPMVASYQALYATNIDSASPQYRGPFNTLDAVARVYTPEDAGIAAPNLDVATSSAVLDLRAEPVVVSVPPMDSRRYFALQLTDLYGQNFAYIGSRATGNGGGHFLIAGPRWKGTAPKHVAKVIVAETELVTLSGRTLMYSASDLANVKRIQAGYKLQPLSAFLKKAAPPAPAPVAWIAPEAPAQMRSSLEFYNQLAFLLQFAPVEHSEKTLRRRLDSLRIRPGEPVVTDRMNPRLRQMMQEGMHDGQNDIDKRRVALAGKTDTLFADRRTFKNDYLARATGAQVDLGGSSREEALAPAIDQDSAGQPLDGARAYTLRFAPKSLPPVNAYWSVTLYQLPGQALVANAAKRYTINAATLSSLKRDRDGGVTLTLQPTSPGKGQEANWLPTPPGPFRVAMRYYWPKPALLDGSWQTPSLQRVAQ
ncbi:DUF1254 domain-containing protein [Achromobacter sp. DH1f]|uniref:DUF1254 domain-containing protein n=1 Tax=Achromobacter sp. DH1f TaxID=1397275 RepID=UPI00046AE2E2|nr:DUF1254 domain-containing protein [Achromobacter sp. DH1f]